MSFYKFFKNFFFLRKKIEFFIKIGYKTTKSATQSHSKSIKKLF